MENPHPYHLLPLSFLFNQMVENFRPCLVASFYNGFLDLKKKKKLMSPTQKSFFGNMFSENLYVEQAIHTSTKNSLATGQSLPVRLFLVHYGRMHKSNLPGCLFQLASKVLTGK